MRIPTLARKSEVTFDGYDGDALVTERIVLWKSLDPMPGTNLRAIDNVSTIVPHGSKGRFLKRKGRGVRVEVDTIDDEGNPKTVKAWCTFYFIKEEV